MTAESTAPIVAARGLTKAYYGNTVLSDVGIDILGGTIHALLGENGAGKSTLINLIAGNVQPDAGSITIGGTTYAAMTPSLAHAHGIAVVHQELSLVPAPVGRGEHRLWARCRESESCSTMGPWRGR